MSSQYFAHFSTNMKLGHQKFLRHPFLQQWLWHSLGEHFGDTLWIMWKHLSSGWILPLIVFRKWGQHQLSAKRERKRERMWGRAFARCLLAHDSNVALLTAMTIIVLTETIQDTETVVECQFSTWRLTHPLCHESLPPCSGPESVALCWSWLFSLNVKQEAV